jgi:hypothetical protein
MSLPLMAEPTSVHIADAGQATPLKRLFAVPTG